MEKLKKLGGKNIYIALAATSMWFAGLWLYSKILKPLLIRREVTKLIERLENEHMESGKK
jgi:cell division protein FtsL